ncbi:hypothetical protein [Stratiformator vulcanicus]|uniref:Uncharacterized protein n=1 Tax=Stratiformator vulcanicus TaxID=2527980 RepID=A0A517R3M7_9PLAN|nr:hypothetical protein [Stratiformator vulcanicus]QDT38433.1 hypothetical protein Pan189_28270 [Stratiformator vulcanicus]
MSSGYSADVRLSLTIEDREILLAQIAPDRIVLREATVIEPGRGEVHMEVDGRMHSLSESLPDGASADDIGVDIRLHDLIQSDDVTAVA